MSLGRKARLARATARLHPPVWPDPEKHRQELLHGVELGLVLREALPKLGVDPAEVTMLEVCDEAAGELRSLGHEVPDRPRPGCWLTWFLDFASGPPSAKPDDEPERPPLPDDDPRVQLLDMLARKVDRHLADPAIDFARASLMEVYFWCAARLVERWWVPEEAGADSDDESDFAAD